MVVEVISVGTELLLGNIVNTNAQYLAGQCAQLGLSMYHQTTIGDNESRLSEALTQALDRSDVVILTGGLGPTEDDLTKETCAKVMGLKLILRTIFTPVLQIITGSRLLFRREPLFWIMTMGRRLD